MVVNLYKKQKKRKLNKLRVIILNTSRIGDLSCILSEAMKRLAEVLCLSELLIVKTENSLILALYEREYQHRP
jgi:hypothetical protein